MQINGRIIVTKKNHKGKDIDEKTKVHEAVEKCNCPCLERTWNTELSYI